MSRGVLTQNQICLVGYTSDIIVGRSLTCPSVNMRHQIRSDREAGTVHGGVGVHITSLSLAQLVVTLKVRLTCPQEA